jgi:outer membrane immunogenic protein
MGNLSVIRRAATAFAVAGVLMLGSAAAKADEWGPVGVTDVQAVTDWSGIYIGGKLGGVWSDLNWTQDANLFNGGIPGAAADFSPSGFAGGIIGGGNVQIGQWIFGAELSYSGVSLSQTITSPYFPATDTFSSKIDYIGTVEARIGYSFNRVLVFGKGGWAGSNASLTLVNNVTGATSVTDDFVDGWTIGGGVELLTWSSFVIGLEYDYVSLNLSTAASCPLCVAGIVGGVPAAVGGDATISSVMVRASYLFMPED